MFTLSRNLSNTDSVKQALASANTSTGTDLPTADTVAKRDADGSFSVNVLRSNAIESIGTTLNIATENNTQNINIGSGTGVQSVNIGNNGSGSTSINIGGSGDFVNISGTLATVNTTNTQVLDKSLVLNAGGAAASSGTAGIYFQEAADTSSSFMRVASDRTKMELKPFAGNLITLNQSLTTTDAPTFGGLTTNSNINMAGNSALICTAFTVRKRIIVFERGDPLSGSDHRFDGIGKIANEMIFQIGAGDIVYYFATSATTSNELLRIAGTGLVSISDNLTVAGRISTPLYNIIGDGSVRFTSTDTRKRVVLTDWGVSTSSTDHRFAGLGKASGQNVYQAAGVAEDHVFFAATSSSSSNELMRIKGNGAVQIPGTLAVTGASTLSGGASVLGALNVQYNVNCSSVAATGNVSCASLTIGGTAFTAAPAYEEFSFATNWSGAFATLKPDIIRIVKIGSLVTMSWGGFSDTTTTTSYNITSTVDIPARFRIADATVAVILGQNAGVLDTLFMGINSIGQLYVGPVSSTGFINTGAFRLDRGSMSWTLLF
jgi:hypothetical protein